MSAPRILGVDAGGTGTRAVLVSDGAVVARFDDGPLNLLLHEDAFERLVLLIKESGATAAGLGLAGLRGAAEGRALQAKLSAATGADVAIADDTEVALLGAFDGGPGIVVIAGTGSNAFGRDAQGRAARVGGHGFLLGDEGSAYWIANTALRAALHSHDGTGPKSVALEDAVTAVYGLDFDAIVRLVHTNPADRQLVARAARAVMELDDSVMGKILDDAAQALVTMALALRAKLGDDLPVAMHGGIFRNPRIRDAFVAGTGAVAPAKSPEFGALHLLTTMSGAGHRDEGWTST
ncbi:MAG TPA: BadF/BadG/BcrA/BcrD ATPase family protein [Acidothermaceae bacterium]|nr:BadF/BadG/BcrA/BcrD ATPase family protein [Acidothermaceae bacterium]